MSTLDIAGAIVLLLKADAFVAEQVGTRVFGEELPGNQAESMPRKAIVVDRVGAQGGPGGYANLERGTFDLVCYGETPYEADKVRRAAHDALRQAPRKIWDVTLLHGFEIVSSAASLREDTTTWPLMLETWKYLASEATPA